MQRTFLEKIWAGYQVQSWADDNRLTLIRVRFNRKGAIIYAMPRGI